MLKTQDFRKSGNILIQRQLEPLRARLMLYSKVLKQISDSWESSPVSELRQDVARQIPEGGLFPVWDSVYRAKQDTTAAAELRSNLEHGINEINSCVHGKPSVNEPSVIGRWRSVCDDYRRLYSKLNQP
jgi:hypothetical protein